MSAMLAGFESLVRCFAVREVLGIDAHNVGNMDQTMIFVMRGSTERAYSTGESGSAPGFRKRSGARLTFTVNCVNYGGRFDCVYVILDSNSKDGRLTSGAKQKLQAFGLQPGSNILPKSGTRVHVTSSTNGWMKAHHLPSLTLTQRSDRWRILTADNWTHFNEDCAKSFESSRVVFINTPANYSLIYNFLGNGIAWIKVYKVYTYMHVCVCTDVNVHGLLKRHQVQDRGKDMCDPNLVKHFRTSTGKLKAGSQFLTLRNLV